MNKEQKIQLILQELQNEEKFQLFLKKLLEMVDESVLDNLIQSLLNG